MQMRAASLRRNSAASPSASQDSGAAGLADPRWQPHRLPLVPLLQNIAPLAGLGERPRRLVEQRRTGFWNLPPGCWGNSGMGSPYRSFDAQYFGVPQAAAVCSLSDALETGDVPQRYF